MTGYPSFRILPADDRGTLVAELIAGNLVSMAAAAKLVQREPQAVAAYLRQIVAAFGRGGQVFDCRCGQPLFHSYACGFRYSRDALAIGVPAEGKRRIIRDLLAGVGNEEIATRHRVTYNQVHNIQRSMTPAEKATRRKNRRTVAEQPAYRDTLYQRIVGAIPRQMNPALRDDIISEIYVAVLDGTLNPDAIEREAGRFVNAGYAAWASRYGPRSLDEAISADDHRTRAEMIPDPSALAAFDDIQFERERL